MRSDDTTIPAQLTIEVWADSVIDTLGFPPQHPYSELVMTSIWGPSTVLCWRRLASTLDQRTAGFTLEVADLAHALGLGAGTAQHSPMSRTLRRLAMFGMARFTDATTYAVRRRIPPASASQLRRMHPQLAAIHNGLLAHHDARRLSANGAPPLRRGA